MKLPNIICMILLTLTLKPFAEGTTHSPVPQIKPDAHACASTYPVLPSDNQIHQLDIALEQYRHGDEIGDRELREVGLANATHLLREMHDAGVQLNVEPTLYHVEEFAHHVGQQTSNPFFHQISSRRQWVVGKLRTCLLVAHLACGYNIYDPASSNITELGEVEQPVNPFRLRYSSGT